MRSLIVLAVLLVGCAGATMNVSDPGIPGASFTSKSLYCTASGSSALVGAFGVAVYPATGFTRATASWYSGRPYDSYAGYRVDGLWHWRAGSIIGVPPDADAVGFGVAAEGGRLDWIDTD